MYSSLSSLPAFSYFLALTSSNVSEIHWEVSGVVFSTPGQSPAATQMEFHHKSSMHAFGSMSAILYPSLVTKDILLQESTTTINSDCSFHLIRLIVSGDISVNPRPENCVVCLKPIARNHQALSCDQCESWCQFMSTVMWKEADKDDVSL